MNLEDMIKRYGRNWRHAKCRACVWYHETRWMHRNMCRICGIEFVPHNKPACGNFIEKCEDYE